MIDQSTILLVDDNADDIFLMKRAFAKAGLSNPIQVAKGGEEAIRYLKGDGIYADRNYYPLPVLTMLDLKMTGVSGFEVLSWIRQQPQLQGLLVLVLSHSNQISDINRAYRLGANSFLVKPENFNRLVEMLQSVKDYWLVLSEKPKPPTAA